MAKGVQRASTANRHKVASIYEGSKYLIHVKISSAPRLPGSLHIIGVYLPSGGNYRKERMHLMKVIGLGDFNVKEEELMRELKCSTRDLQKFSVVGSAWMRFPSQKGSQPVGIDHFIGNENAKAIIIPKNSSLKKLSNK